MSSSPARILKYAGPIKLNWSKANFVLSCNCYDAIPSREAFCAVVLRDDIIVDSTSHFKRASHQRYEGMRREFSNQHRCYKCLPDV